MTYNRAVRNSTKSTRIKLARWIQKNLKNINWYSCYESSNAGKCHTFLVSFIIPLDGLNDLGLALLCGARYFQRFLNEPHEQRSHLTQHLFSKAGFRKLFSLKNNLCPGLVLYVTWQLKYLKSFCGSLFKLSLVFGIFNLN